MARSLNVIFLLGFLPIIASPVPLGSPCLPSTPCSTPHSRCHGGICECQPYYVQYNNTECLQSTLLGDDCVLPEQCSLKVSHSSCIEATCQCEPGFLRFRRHTCLSPAKPGDICYSDEHCELNTDISYCDFTIPNLFGVCRCREESDYLDSFCQLVSEESSDGFTTTITSELDDLIESDNLETSESNTTNSEEEDLEEVTKKPFENPNKDGASKLNEERIFQSLLELLKHDKNKRIQTSSSTSSEAKYREELEDVLYFAPTSSFVYRGSPVLLPLDDKRPLSLLNKLIGKQAALLKQTEEVDAVSLGLPCERTEQCMRSDQNSVCRGGVCDCSINNGDNKNKTITCSKSNTGCYPGTFQCRGSGVCLSWFFVCDGRRDCPDGSDEECSGPECSALSYQCGNRGICVSRSVVCDGKKNCPDGEDESDCSADARNSTNCPEHSFRCSNGQCVPQYEFCNAIPACDDGTDEPEALCRTHRLPSRILEEEYCPFRCSNGRCRSTAIVCSGRDGCGDNSDEAQCSVCKCQAP